ncbi:MAG TPA: hypothetical protein VNH11_02440 [Pirellulales bacterium]|nr:hypothetical protein [Pirellulales bacterium]HVA45220.1 hypothetical protein [Pirellulales bacterium]
MMLGVVTAAGFALATIVPDPSWVTGTFMILAQLAIPALTVVGLVCGTRQFRAFFLGCSIPAIVSLQIAAGNVQMLANVGPDLKLSFGMAAGQMRLQTAAVLLATPLIGLGCGSAHWLLKPEQQPSSD